MHTSLARRMGALAAVVAVACTGIAGAVTAGPAAAASDPTWHAQYFATADLTGPAVVTREDANIDFDWNQAAPDPALPIDNFSVRWTRAINFAAGTYRFDTSTDDGVRVFVDGNLVIDHWVDQAPTEWQADVALTAGDHTVVMEYFDHFGGAVARLLYAPVNAGGSGAWVGQYFGNKNLANQPLLTRNDPSINFNWAGGAPAFGLPSTNFSARWTRTVTTSPGSYYLVATVDDGVRVLVDGTPVIDHWIEEPLTTYSADLTLTGGSHTIVVEYFQAFGDSSIQFNYALRPAGGIVRINSGGPAYADTFNQFWNADTGATGGVTAEEAQPIWNTTDDPLYINERAAPHTYNIAEPNGSYIVRLHFAELFFSAPGVRRFNVAIQGQPVLSSFDIYAEAGHASLLTKSFPATVTNGSLSIDFSNVFDNAEIAAIDIYPAGGTEDLTAPTFAAIPEPENATYSTPPAVSVNVTDDHALLDGYWRLDDQAPLPLFAGTTNPTFGQQFTVPVEAFNALSLGSHTLSFGADDQHGNAAVRKWRFRKLNSGQGSVPIAFNRRVLVAAGTPGASALKHPTSIQFGPDGKLYVGQQDGYIHVLTLDANRNVTAVSRINTVYNTPTVNTDGSVETTTPGRHLIGIDFDPKSTPTHPILWAVHSDPRFCFNQTPATCGVNPDSGILTRLDGPNFDTPANRTDVVTGLPRSRENHAPNAVHFGPDGWLYLSIGSDTNYGAPSTAFSGLSERYLTAAIVRMNVNGNPGAFPRDVRNVTSAAGLTPGAFELYATGYRNPYDFLWHTNGKLYANVNAGNFTAGNLPGPADGCPSGQSFDPGTRADYLAIVNHGDYGGNPDPARGECVLDDGSMYTPPQQPLANYHAPILHYSNGTSSDGMTEYTAPTFGGQMLHNIISATYAGNQSVRRVVLSADGSSVLFEEDLAIFNQPLDVAVGSEGSIYVAEYGANDLQIMEPAPPMQGQWTTKASLPVPTEEIGVVGCAGKVYAMGGLTAPNTDTNALWIYDPATDQWTAGPSYPGTAVDHPGTACVNGKVYLVGGLINVGNAVATVLAYDPIANTWSQKADLPNARGGAGVTTLNGKIYVAGGLGYPAKSDLYAYDPAANIWQTLASMPTARDHLVLEAIDGKLYAIGGRNVTINSVMTTNEVYDPTTNLWSARAGLPIAEAAMASAGLHGHVQVWGGEGPSGTPGQTFNTGFDYDPRTNTWNPIAPQPTPRHGTDAATVGNDVYLPGGAPQTGNSVTDVNEVFSFISTTPVVSCIAVGSDPRVTDSDGDQFMNQDETDNATDPCNPSSTPPDFNHNHVSDLNDPDDDGDGVLDHADQFQFDPTNGTTTVLPWVQNWNPGDPPAGLFANSGFSGTQLTSHGTGYIDGKVHVGGAGGFLSLNATAGTNQGTTNSQDDALQIGFDASHSTQVSARLADPFNGLAVEAGKAGGIFVGNDEDNSVKLLITADGANGGPGLVLGTEISGVFRANPGIAPLPIDLTALHTLDLFLILDPVSHRITARYRLGSDLAVDIHTMGSADQTVVPGLGALFHLGGAAGIIATNPAPSPFGVALDWFRIDPVTSTPQTITFGPLANKTNKAAPFTVSATASSGLPVTFSSSTNSVCTVSGTTVTVLAVGTCTITAAQAGDAQFAPAPNVVRSFTVTASPLKVTSVAPTSRGQGASAVTVTVTGAGFVAGSMVSFTGSGITVTSTSFTSSTKLTAVVNVAGSAATGARGVKVTLPSLDSTTCAGCFTVNAGPKMTSATPATIARSKSNVSVTINGTGFATGATLKVSGTGLTLSSVTRVSATKITAKLASSSTATRSLRTYTVTNPDGGTSTLAALTVT